MEILKQIFVGDLAYAFLMECQVDQLRLWVRQYSLAFLRLLSAIRSQHV